jgi:hypothetical protein
MPCTATQDRLCVPCSVGYQFCNGVTATDCNRCTGTNMVVKQACTATTDAVCMYCPTGSYCVNGTVSNCTTCPRGQYDYIPCSIYADTVCRPCPAEYICSGGTILRKCWPPCILSQYETTPCNGIYDRQCSACPQPPLSPTYNYCDGVNYYPCKQCATGQYMYQTCRTSNFSGTCGDCVSDYYCPNNYSIIPCYKCPLYAYVSQPCTTTTDTQCSVCKAEEYCNGTVRQNCTSPCIAGTYQSVPCNATTNRVCLPCALGSFSLPNTTFCTACLAGSFLSSATASLCTACVAGTYSSLSGSTVCVACAAGSYSLPSTTFCTICLAGSFLSSATASQCSTCAAGTYASSSGSTACLGCSTCVYNVSSCNLTANTGCCHSASVGTYKSNCTTELACPALPNGAYVLNGYSLNRCGDFQCNAGYFATPSNAAAAKAACNTTTTIGLLRYGLGSGCAAALGSLCVPFTTCGSGTTVLRDLAGAPIVNSVTQDVQCTACVGTCANGSVKYSDCTSSAQTVCSKCSSQGTIRYGYQSQCLLLSEVPKGYYPYQLTFNPTYMSQFTTNQAAWPTKQLLDDGSVIDLPWTTAFSLNTFLPCNAPPEGYVFKAWSAIPPIQTLAYTGQTTISTDCSLQSSTECIDYSAASSKGWFRNASGLCQPCTRTSTYTTCTWGQFRDLGTCTKLQDSACMPCRGTLPANGVWTMAKSPFYFDSTTASPCDWDCNAGFYKDSATQTCKACTNIPANANADVGPFRPRGVTIPATICLDPRDPSTCKYFGGTELNGCDWRCKTNYEVKTSTDLSFTCAPCPTVTCLPGEQKYINTAVGGCEACQICTPLVLNAQYGAECSFTCNPGYYKSSSTMCSPCSVATCPANYYSGGCGGSSDSSCQLCSSCAIGTRVGTPCSATADTVCVPCTDALVPNSAYSSTCAVVCNAGYVMVNGLCVACAASNADCPVGRRYNATCTSENVGCSNCTAPATLNWCWTAGSVCAWDCLRLYKKTNGVCNYDTTKTWNVNCLSVPVTTAAPTTTTNAPTTTTAIQTTTVLQTTTAIQGTTALQTTTSMQTTTSLKTTTALQTTSTTPPPTTAAEPIVVRDTLTVSQVTVQECACRANDLNQRLSGALGSPTFIISCEQGDVVVLCTNFTCPCTSGARRRLLQAADTQINYVVKVPPTNPAPTPQLIQAAIQPVLARAVVVSVAAREVLPTTTITWDQTVLLFKRAADDASAATVGVVVAVVIVFIAIVATAIGVGVYCCTKQPAPPKPPMLAIKLRP